MNSDKPECQQCYDESGSLACFRPSHTAFDLPKELKELTPVLTQLSKICHERNQHWWHDPKTGVRLERNKGEMLMLMVSEIAEAMEGERKNLQDDKLPHRRMVEVELADVLIRIFDYAGAYGMDLGGAVLEKMEYNRTRPDHQPAARLAAHGKKW